MFFLVTFWAATLNLLLLVMALAWAPAFWSQPIQWLSTLPWGSFGTELGGLLQMQTVDAGVLWALWLSVSAALLLGCALAYGTLRRHAPKRAVAALPAPKVADMFGQLSNSLSGLQGFGELDDVPFKPAGVVPTLQVRVPQQPAPQPSTQQQPAQHQPAPNVLAVHLQGIDPELSSSFDAVLRELGQTPRAS